MNKLMHAEIVENGRPPGALRHKMTAGIEFSRTFRDEEERDDQLDTLESLLPVTQQRKGDIPLFCCFDRLRTTIGSDW